MVKGISKRVIVVKAPVSSMFEQAIFILGDSALSGSSVDAENILREACAVADDYVRSHCGAKRRISRQTFATALVSSAVTLLTSIIFYTLFL